ncbi:hypothetical protein, partial [Pseudoramibacter alactolyticus]|uniref:hypothetical protein n=1 Tax=Pseudoramibacter alactolyticus TaxID=113287 RepID=UPI001A9858ED
TKNDGRLFCVCLSCLRTMDIGHKLAHFGNTLFDTLFQLFGIKIVSVGNFQFLKHSQTGRQYLCGFTISNMLVSVTRIRYAH